MRKAEELRALSALLPEMLAAEPARALSARRSVAELLLRTPPQDLSWLEQEIRYLSRRDVYFCDASAAGSRWRRLDSATLLHASTEADGEAVLWASSFHNSGFVREKAVYLLDEERDGKELPFLLLRLNDWVRVVQSAARGAVTRRLSPDYAAAFIANISLCQRLLEQRRNDQKELHQRILTLLRSREAAPAREAALDSADKQVRRAAFVLSTEAENGDLRAVLLRALRSDDLWLRIFAARTARTRLYGAALRETLGQARGDRSVPVRREALLGFVEEYPELRQSLLDPCASLREMVRFYLRKQANLDFAGIYRQEIKRLAESKEGRGLSLRLATALCGIGETGGQGDVETVELFTIDARPRVRSAALRALARLDGQGCLPTLFAALSDPHPGVLRTTLEQVGSRLPLLGAAGLLRAYEEQENPQCRHHLLAAAAAQPRWVSERLLRAACADADAELSAQARQLLGQASR